MTQTNGLPKKILVIDDDRSICMGIQNQLQKFNVTVQFACDLDSALYQFNQQTYDVAVVELEFEPLAGLALIQKYRKINNGNRNLTSMLVMSGRARNVEDDTLLKELGDIEIVEKPIQAIKLLPFLSRGLERKTNALQFEEVRQLAMKAKSTDDAVKRLKLSEFPADNPRVNLACDLYEKDARFQDAIGVLDPALRVKANDLSFVNRKAQMLLHLNKTDEAKELFEKADKAAPKNLERIETLAKVYLKVGMPDDAVNKMRDIIKLNPEMQDLKFDLFNDLENAGFRKHAVALCQETSNPKDVVRFYNNKGVMLSKGGDAEGALKEYYTALIFFPKNKENYRILFNIALAELNKKTPEGDTKALDALKNCLQLAPDFEKALHLLPQVEKKVGQLKQAS